MYSLLLLCLVVILRRLLLHIPLERLPLCLSRHAPHRIELVLEVGFALGDHALQVVDICGLLDLGVVALAGGLGCRS
jgi:hypothetical protein